MGEWKKVLVSGSDIEVGQITASDLSEASKPHIVVYDTGSGALHYTSSDAIGGVGGTIGTPSDSAYTDGFFDTFTGGTSIADAIDEISEAFLDLAPAKAGVLTGVGLVKTDPPTFSGYLAGGLISTHWYVGTSAHSLISTLTSDSSVELDTPDTSTRFRAGKYSDLFPTNQLGGGVTSSITYGDANSPTTEDSRALSDDEGSTGTIQIEDLTQYNTFWAKANAKINHTLSNTGSYKYTITADNGAGETEETQLFYVGSLTDYPNQSVTINSIVTSSVTFNYLSGISYLKTATFTIDITGENLYDPVYSFNQVRFASYYFANINSGNTSPSWDDTLNLSITRSLNTNLNSGISNPTMILYGYKPGKSNVNDTATLSTTKVNSYNSTQDSNGNSAIIKFLDEDYRMENLQTTSWNSTATLIDGNLQVRNGRLIVGQYGDYPSLTQGGGGGGTADFFWKSDPTGDYRISGDLELTKFNNVNAFLNDIEPWGTGELNIALILSSDVSGPNTATAIYDLGRAVGNNSGNIYGIRNSITKDDTNEYDVTWALPSGVNTGLASSTYVILWVRFRDTESNDYLTQINLTYN